MESSDNSNWFGNFKNKISELYKKAKDSVASKPESEHLLANTASTVGGSKKRKSKKRVRFSKRTKVYKFNTRKQTYKRKNNKSLGRKDKK